MTIAIVTIVKEMKNAVVVQGEYKGQRTLDAIDHYLKDEAVSIVILSTWEGTADDELEARVGSRFVIIRSVLPEGAGDWNRHYQMHSTYAGVLKARELKATHILKTRTDQLLRKLHVMDFFHENLVQYGENRLIIGSDITTLAERWGKFHIGDFWMFGKIEHFLLWYDIESIDTSQTDFIPGTFVKSPEPDFAQLWVNRRGITCSSFPELLGKYFIVIDSIDVELIYKTLPLNVTHAALEGFWMSLRPDRVSHAFWKTMLPTRAVRWRPGHNSGRREICFTNPE